MSNDIAGKIVVITGASSGLGEAAARMLSAEGATVVPNHITHEAFAANIQKFYQDTAIPADSFARTVLFAMSQPEDVDINEILFRPTSLEL